MGWFKREEPKPVSIEAHQEQGRIPRRHRDARLRDVLRRRLHVEEISTSEYIRDPRFEVIICGVKVGTGPTIILEGKALERRFKQIDWSKTDLLCHNTPFDGFIMSHHYGVKPRRYLDTLAMARGLHGNDIRGRPGLGEPVLWRHGEDQGRAWQVRLACT
jgi:hypothetical protein